MVLGEERKMKKEKGRWAKFGERKKIKEDRGDSLFEAAQEGKKSKEPPSGSPNKKKQMKGAKELPSGSSKEKNQVSEET